MLLSDTHPSYSTFLVNEKNLEEIKNDEEENSEQIKATAPMIRISIDDTPLSSSNISQQGSQKDKLDHEDDDDQEGIRADFSESWGRFFFKHIWAIVTASPTLFYAAICYTDKNIADFRWLTTDAWDDLPTESAAGIQNTIANNFKLNIPISPWLAMSIVVITALSAYIINHWQTLFVIDKAEKFIEKLPRWYVILLGVAAALCNMALAMAATASIEYAPLRWMLILAWGGTNFFSYTVTRTLGAENLAVLFNKEYRIWHAMKKEWFSLSEEQQNTVLNKISPNFLCFRQAQSVSDNEARNDAEIINTLEKEVNDDEVKSDEEIKKPTPSKLNIKKTLKRTGKALSWVEPRPSTSLLNKITPIFFGALDLPIGLSPWVALIARSLYAVHRIAVATLLPSVSVFISQQVCNGLKKLGVPLPDHGVSYVIGTSGSLATIALYQKNALLAFELLSDAWHNDYHLSHDKVKNNAWNLLNTLFSQTTAWVLACTISSSYLASAVRGLSNLYDNRLIKMMGLGIPLIMGAVNLSFALMLRYENRRQKICQQACQEIAEILAEVESDANASYESLDAARRALKRSISLLVKYAKHTEESAKILIDQNQHYLTNRPDWLEKIKEKTKCCRAPAIRKPSVSQSGLFSRGHSRISSIDEHSHLLPAPPVNGVNYHAIYPYGAAMMP